MKSLVLALLGLLTIPSALGSTSGSSGQLQSESPLKNHMSWPESSRHLPKKLKKRAVLPDTPDTQIPIDFRAAKANRVRYWDLDYVSPCLMTFTATAVSEVGSPLVMNCTKSYGSYRGTQTKCKKKLLKDGHGWLSDEGEALLHVSQLDIKIVSDSGVWIPFSEHQCDKKLCPFVRIYNVNYQHPEAPLYEVSSPECAACKEKKDAFCHEQFVESKRKPAINKKTKVDQAPNSNRTCSRIHEDSIMLPGYFLIILVLMFVIWVFILVYLLIVNTRLSRRLSLVRKKLNPECTLIKRF